MENRGAKIIGKVKEYFEKARALYPEITNDMLDTDGAIYYMNANDGTDFDWFMNDRCCEFYIFYNNDCGFIKVFVNADDTLTGYIYLDRGYSEAIYLEKKYLNEEDALYLASLMNKIADKEGIYDQPIDKLNFNTELDYFDFLYPENDYEDDEEEEW